jgi:hypothetical protein
MAGNAKRDAINEVIHAAEAKDSHLRLKTPWTCWSTLPGDQHAHSNSHRGGFRVSSALRHDRRGFAFADAGTASHAHGD